MTFDEFWDTTKAAATPETFAGWERSCRQAWNAGATAMRDMMTADGWALLAPEEKEAVRKAQKERAWNVLRRLDLCRCDHNEYCAHCWPVEFRPGGAWEPANVM